jgi:hypothetical protein
VKRFAFVAELVGPPDNSERSVRFRYVIDGSAELSLPREWWEQLGAPEEIEVSVEPNSE